MPLQSVTDLSVADFFVDSGADVWTVALMGPPGFEAYARVWFCLDADDEQHVGDTEVLHRVQQVLMRHTRSTTAFFGFWEGSGCLDGHPAEALMSHPARLHLFDGPPPHSGSSMRSYHLLTGAIDDADAWSSAGALHLAWPTDRSWFLAEDVDPDWIGIGGSRAVIDELLAHPDLDARPSAHVGDDWESP